MGKHYEMVNKTEERIKQYAERLEQINCILNSYNMLIEEKRKYEYYLRTQIQRGHITKKEYDVIKNKGLVGNHRLIQITSDVSEINEISEIDTIKINDICKKVKDENLYKILEIENKYATCLGFDGYKYTIKLEELEFVRHDD